VSRTESRGKAASPIVGQSADDSLRALPLAPDDRELVQQCLDGNSVAMRALVERYQGLLFGLCYRLVGHRHDAEDLVQEVFLRAFRSLAGWDASRPLRPWLAKIAVNCCRTALANRSRRQTPVDFLDHVEDERLPHANSNDFANDLGEELQRALKNLREEYRTCFVMYHHQELPLAEIASVLDRPEGTIKIWLFRARRELAEQLQQRGVCVRR